MNSCKPWFFAPVVVVFSMFGCGGPETYSEQHLSTIQFDCQETAACDPAFSARADGVSECIKDTSTKLDIGSDMFRATYEQRFARCAGRTGLCAYYDCAQSNDLFSILNEPALRNECQQNVVCKIQMMVPTAPNDADQCFIQLASQLDSSTVPDRASWQQRVMRCTGQVGCAYMSCR